MPERQADPEAKKGVHGWRAFFLMFGCGTTAAFAVVGTVVGAAQMLGNVVTEGVSEPTDEVDGTWQPAPSMTPGALNLCRTMETSTQTGAFQSMFPERVDDEDGYSDPGPGADGRTVKDDCEWTLKSPEHGDWTFSLSYEASVSQGAESDRIEEARERLEGIRNESLEEFSSVSNSEEMSDVADEAYADYGLPVEGEGGSLYFLHGRTRSGVFEVRIENPSENVPESEYRELVRKVSPVLSKRLERVLPE